MILSRIHWLCPDCGTSIAITAPNDPPTLPPICDRCGEDLTRWSQGDLPIVRHPQRVISPITGSGGGLESTLIDANFPCDRCHAPCQGQDCFCEPCDGVFCAACYPIHLLDTHRTAAFASALVAIALAKL